MMTFSDITCVETDFDDWETGEWLCKSWWRFLSTWAFPPLFVLLISYNFQKSLWKTLFLEVTTLPVGKVPSHVEGEETKEDVERVSQQQLPGQKLTTHNVVVFNVWTRQYVGQNIRRDFIEMLYTYSSFAI